MPEYLEDPEDLDNPEVDRHGVDRSADAEGKRIDDAYERHVQKELRDGHPRQEKTQKEA